MLNDIKFIPLDLPYANCDSDKIKNYMDRKGKRTDYNWTKKINDPWNHVVVRLPELAPLAGEIPGSGWRADFKRTFPDVVSTVESFPYTQIDYVYILEQIIDVEPHLDYASKNPYSHLEPATYRITLLIEDTNTFYFCKDTECNHKKFPVFPEDTNSWVFSNKEFMHGSFTPKNGRRKILLAVGGILDENRHSALISRSEDKYKNFIIT
jgi:hypothetical protein